MAELSRHGTIGVVDLYEAGEELGAGKVNHYVTDGIIAVAPLTAEAAAKSKARGKGKAQTEESAAIVKHDQEGEDQAIVPYEAVKAGKSSMDVLFDEAVLCDTCGSHTIFKRGRCLSKKSGTWRCRACDRTTMSLRRKYGSWPTEGFSGLSKDSLATATPAITSLQRDTR